MSVKYEKGEMSVGQCEVEKQWPIAMTKRQVVKQAKSNYIRFVEIKLKSEESGRQFEAKCFVNRNDNQCVWSVEPGLVAFDCVLCIRSQCIRFVAVRSTRRSFDFQLKWRQIHFERSLSSIVRSNAPFSGDSNAKMNELNRCAVKGATAQTDIKQEDEDGTYLHWPCKFKCANMTTCLEIRERATTGAWRNVAKLPNELRGRDGRMRKRSTRERGGEGVFGKRQDRRKM